MIILDSVTAFSGRGGRGKELLSAASLIIPSDRRIALLGRSRDETSSLLNLFGGLQAPAGGHVIRKARVSFPAGYLGGFVRDLPVRVNVAHLARIYQADVPTTVGFVDHALRLGAAYDKPFDELPRKTQKRLAAFLVYVLPFDVYLQSDEVAAGKRNRKNVALHLFEERHRTAGMIITTSNPKFAVDYCDMAMVLSNGQLILSDDVEAAFALIPQRERRRKHDEDDDDDDNQAELAKQERRRQRRELAGREKRKLPQDAG
jgi:capsular polysaccharide transport system ATP-binding protein